MIYAGIGSRSTPIEVIDKMIALSSYMATQGHLLRSGAADGADRAFEHGCDNAGGTKEIWLPWRGFNGSKSDLILPEFGAQFDRAMALAESVHPAWHRCTSAAVRLHARNVLQILGADFNTPVDRVICWTPNAAIVGGTATALRLAQQYNIEIVNLWTAESPSPV